MQQKKVGIVLLIVGLIFLVFVTGMKLQDDARIRAIINETGSCYLADSTCLHDQQGARLVFFIIGWILAGLLTLFGAYLAFVDKSQEQMMQHQQTISQALENAKHQDSKKEQFEAFLSAFEDEEKAIIKAIHDEEGITQSTLRYKTNISKATLSEQLKRLEDKQFIKRVPKGKTKQIYLVKKF